MNVYPGEKEAVVTANCAEIKSSNNPTNAGLVHVVSRVLKPVEKTLAELIRSEPSLSMFSKGKRDRGSVLVMIHFRYLFYKIRGNPHSNYITLNLMISVLENSNLTQMLEEHPHMTVFAPNNAAFEKMESGLRNKYLRGQACIKS